MDYHFYVDEKDYITALEYSFRQKLKGPSWMAFQFICTFGQLSLCLACAFDAFFTGKTMYYILGASILLFALSIVYFRDTEAQAKSDLNRLKSKKRISEGFWKQHTVSMRGGIIRIKYGGKEQVLDDWLLSTVRYKNVLLLMQGWQIADVIPLSMSEQDADALEKRLHDEAEKGAVIAAEKARNELPENACANYVCKLSDEVHFAAQCHALRRFYLTRYSLSLARILLILISAGLIAYTILYFSITALLICIYVCVFLNLRYFIVFTPFIKPAVRRSLSSMPTFLPGGESKISVYSEGLSISGSAYCIYIPREDIRGSLNIPEGLAICGTKGNFFIITDTGDALQYNELKSELANLLSKKLGEHAK